MSMQFMSWSLNEPSNAQFLEFAKEDEAGEWTIINRDAYLDWPGDQRNFWTAFQEHNEKIASFGLHDFGVRENGTVYHYKAGTSYPVLNQDGAIQYWARNSLLYLMDHYPNVEWFLQAICFGSPVETMLDQEENQSTFIRQFRSIVSQYMTRFPGRIKGIEIDFEKSSSRPREAREAEKYRDFLARVKNEIAIPLQLKVRVNLHAMTGDFAPYWYQWTDYRTLAEGRDERGQMICDEWQIMSYDFAHNNSAPGPSTPVWWLKQVLAHVQNVFPSESVWIGNAAYGRRWPLESKRSGTAVRYWQMLMWQNGIFKHHIGRDPETDAFTWVDQSYVPYTGLHDEESGYQQTFSHCYDRFRVAYADLLPYNNRPVIYRSTYQGTEYITSYSKHQRATFEHVHAVLHQPTQLTGNATRTNTTWRAEQFPQTFQGVAVGGARYLADHDLERCVKDVDEGRAVYRFTLPAAGIYELIAPVYFPYLNPKIHLLVNGTPYVIGEGIPSWYPFLVNPDRHFYHCGTFSFTEGENEIVVTGTEDSAQLLGLVLSTGFSHNMSGGMVQYNVNLQPPKKRGTVTEGIVNQVEAKMPKKMALTAELLRRPPRPAIFWEDLFGSHVVYDESGNQEKVNLAETNYYLQAGTQVVHGGNYENRQCISSRKAVGYSSGEWVPYRENFVETDARGRQNQLLLNKRLHFFPHLEADLSLWDRGSAGIRFMASNVGATNDGYLFLLDAVQQQFLLLSEENGERQVLASVPATIYLGTRYSLRVRFFEGQILCFNGTTQVFSHRVQGNRVQGAHGVFAQGARVRCHRLHIATLNRYEPMEKVQAIVDGEPQPIALEEDRPYDYDEFGYLMYAGLNPDAGTSYGISNDYENLTVAVVDSWEGAKTIQLRVVDAGVWLRNFYIGDAEGYSLAWNSDIEGFITTLQLIEEAECKGVAMWTLGQEDPTVFTYLPRA
ncbi:glycosyl hydrolase family 18 protein [Shouchella lehensis]|nr:glycosyl hydrolase family 18 protein [Shouchella lehensis]